MTETLTNAQYAACKEQFIKLEQRALSMNHYQLAMETRIEDPIMWKLFLMDPRTTQYIQTEMNIIRSAAINEIIRNAPDSKSVGQAQLINSLVKIEEMSDAKDGPVFIYCYVPLNYEQKFAPYTKELNPDGSDPEENNEDYIDDSKFIVNTAGLSKK